MHKWIEKSYSFGKCKRIDLTFKGKLFNHIIVISLSSVICFRLIFSVLNSSYIYFLILGERFSICLTVNIHSKCDTEDYLRYIHCSMKVFTMSKKIWIIGSQNFRLVANLHNIIDGLSTKATVFNGRLFAWWRPSCIHRKAMSLVIKGNYIW